MILVTGGAGYIGSHTCVELPNAVAHMKAPDRPGWKAARTIDEMCSDYRRWRGNAARHDPG